MTRGRGARGQTTVEFALVLPFLFGALLLVAQLALVVRDQIMVVNAAREGARAAAVDPSLATAREAALGSGSLDATRLRVSMSRTDTTVTVIVNYRSRPGLPIIGPMLGHIDVRDTATMRLETP